MPTTLQALTVALEGGRNATEVMARLAEQGFSVIHTEAVITQAAVVLSCHAGIAQPDAVARTVITSAILGSQFQALMEDG